MPIRLAHTSDHDIIGPCPEGHDYYIDKWNRYWANPEQRIIASGGWTVINTLMRGGYSLDEILAPPEDAPVYLGIPALFGSTPAPPPGPIFGPPVPDPVLDHPGHKKRTKRPFRTEFSPPTTAQAGWWTEEDSVLLEVVTENSCLSEPPSPTLSTQDNCEWGWLGMDDSGE